MDKINVLTYQKELDGAALSNPIHLKRLNSGNAPLFCALYNEAFFNVEGALLMDEQATENLLADINKRAGFILSGGLPLGTFVLDVEQEPVVLCAVSISPEFRGRGYGRLAVLRLSSELFKEGRRRLQLFVSEKNTAARRLYESCGFLLF